MKLVSWNLNGIRAVAKKGLIDIVNGIDADVLCLQETKATEEQVKEVLAELPNHFIVANEAEKKGYSGTAIIAKKDPISVVKGIGDAEHDNEGRVITAEFETCFVVTAYVPNSKGDLSRLGYRQVWDKALLAHLQKLETSKPVLFCGDLNVCHRDIDIARPKANYNKSAGYMQEEIDGLDNFINAGFIDTYRTTHPDEVCYSWWSYRGGAREKNVGWRLDYVLASEKLVPHIDKAFILTNVHGSDHCRVGVGLNV